ncbi:immune inhibitor A domain-containing protein [Shewanella sp. KT0246]|uniref:immune inhibitor A domain-containing protein n=1 Tax=Shewanella sp. KT0246 TaxID=2815912 RepID=UPI001BBD6B4B|nr:immune inhibitor A domain-containing protein [Shewanella sp. KT0246]GIU51275.1 immune inhibitor A [Shewanella sp. KT0246]
MNNNKLIPLAFAIAGLSGSLQAAEHAPIPQTGAFDMVIADEQKLIQMLKNSGKISQTASLKEAESALKVYLKKRQAEAIVNAAAQDAAITNHYSMTQEIKSKTKMDRRHEASKGSLTGRSIRNSPGNVQEELYDGPTREARVLAILMEFPDFVHNSILPEESGMYYEDYNQDHYRQILFGDDGWVAPNGHHANSFRQFYEKQSGDSYTVTGDVAGWYMATMPAAFYGNNVDGDARSLIREALTAASLDPTLDLSQFDIEDRYDLDGDGNYWEPDGLVDHVMVFHSTVGEEAGGGQVGEDAIWSHRWNLGGVYGIPGSATDVPYWGGVMGAFDYTIAPIDSAVGVISHEYGHDLGLPDEYDTQYTGEGEPVSMWSVMSSGSWAGELGGTEPVGFSPFAKEHLQATLGGNWQHGAIVNFDDIPRRGVVGLLDQASSKGTNHDVIKITLPNKVQVVTEPTSGEYAYFSGSGDNLQNLMGMAVDLTAATTSSIQFQTWYDIETDWDYAYVMAVGDFGQVMLEGNITSTTNPNDTNLGNGITGASSGWINAEFDLTSLAGNAFNLYVMYQTDAAVSNPGMYVDDISLVVDEVETFAANADSSPEMMMLDGFEISSGSSETEHYYLVEWRTHHDVDSGLEHINVAGQPMTYEKGMLIWYVDNQFSDNWVGVHPGDGFLGVVDADQNTLSWSNGNVATTRYQIHDATFRIDRPEKMFIDLSEQYGITMYDNRTRAQRTFRDSRDYTGGDLLDAGRNIPEYGLTIRLINQSEDRSVGAVMITK